MEQKSMNGEEAFLFSNNPEYSKAKKKAMTALIIHKGRAHVFRDVRKSKVTEREPDPVVRV